MAAGEQAGINGVVFGERASRIVLTREVATHELRQRRRSGALVRLRRGAYTEQHESQGPARDARRLAHDRIAAVSAQIRLDAVFSHESAALIWGLPVIAPSGLVHLTQRSRPDARSDSILVRHCGALPDEHRTWANGYPVTTLERTVVDCASTLPQDRALAMVDGAARSGLDAEVLARIVAQRQGSRGIVRARHVLDLMDGRSESPGESLLRWHLHVQRWPQPDLQVSVRTRRGRFRLDLGWPDIRAGIEFDGMVKYRSGDPDVLIREKLRQDALEEAGWSLLRVTWPDVSRPAQLRTRIATLRDRACTASATRSGVRDRNR